jgi:hypothetical protein
MQSIKDLDTYGLVLWIGVFDALEGSGTKGIHMKVGLSDSVIQLLLSLVSICEQGVVL